MSEHCNLDNIKVNYIPDAPLFIVEVKDPEFQLNGWVVIHSMGADGACGGIRLYPDVDLHEVELLAKAMTYKYCFFERLTGGAKAGLQLPFDLPLMERQEKLRKFGSHLAPLIRSNIYLPWTDMNSSMDDIKCVIEGAGLSMGQIGDSSYYTALSTFAGVKASAEYYKIPPDKCRITIEGVGNVGKHLAMEIARWGGRIIGATTRLGGVGNPNGIDIEAMINILEKKHDAWVKEKGNWEPISNEEIFSLPMDIHVPCARVLSITEDVAEKIKAKVVVPAANVPCTPGGETKLYSKGIRLLPDFIINGGGIVGTGIAELGGADKDVRNMFFNDFKDMIVRLLRLADKRNETPVRLASIESHRHYSALWASSRKSFSLPEKIFRALEWRGLIPKGYRRLEASKHIIRVVNERFKQE